MSRRKSRPILILGICIFLLMPLTQSFSQERQIEGMTFVSQTEFLELYFDTLTTSLAVFDKRTGRLWASSPIFGEETEEEDPERLELLESPVMYRYSDSDRSEAYIANVFSEETSFTYSLSNQEIVIDFTMDNTIIDPSTNLIRYKGTIDWRVEYRLRDDYLEVNIPDDMIREDGSFMLLSIDVLQWLGAGTETRGGALLLPMGSGIQIPYTDVLPSYIAPFTLPIYGEDHFNFSIARQAVTNMLPEEMTDSLKQFKKTPDSLIFPLFGMLTHGDGLLCISTEGEENGLISVGQYGAIFDYNRSWFKDIYREKLLYPVSRTRTMLKYQLARLGRDRNRRYYFLPGPNADVSTLANRYRRYLQEEKQLAVQKDLNSLMNIRIFCAINKTGMFGDVLVSATTFEQAKEIIETFVQRGMNRIMITLVGWEHDGYFGSAPDKLPPERKIGGTAKLKSLVEYAHSQGMQITLETDFLLASQSTGGFSVRKDVMKYTLDIPITDNHGTYLLAPRVSLENYASKDIPKYKELGVDGLVVRNFGEFLLSDRDRKNPADRRDTINYWTAILELIRENGLTVGVTGRNAYVIPMVDSVHEINLTTRPFRTGGEQIPFFSLVLHGVIPYYSEVLNLSGNLKRDTLKLIENGYLPTFEITYEDPVILRDTAYNSLYSAYWKDWLDPIEEVYDTLIDIYEVAGGRMTSFSEVAPEVFRYDYESGSSIVVNHTPEDIQYGDNTVPAEYFLIVGSGGKSND